MKNFEMTTIAALSLEELVQIDGGIGIDGGEGEIEYGINSPNGCIPNPFDKFLKKSTF